MNDRTTETGFDVESLAPAMQGPGLFFRVRLPLLISSTSLLLAAILLSLFLPRQYSSTMQIVVHAPVAGANTAAFPVEQGVDADRVQAELALLRSEKVASDVIDPDWTNRAPGTRTPDESTRHQAALANFQRHLSVWTDPGSNLLRAACVAGDPHSATDLANRLLRVFIASQGDLPRSNQVTAFFINDAAQARTEMEAAGQALEGYRSQHTVNRPARAMATEQQIADLERQMHDTDEQIGGRAAAILEGERRLAAMPARREVTIDPDAGPVLSVPQLTTMLAIYNDQRATMLTRPVAEGLRKDAVLELSHDIASTSTALHLAQRSRLPGDDPETDPAWQQTNDRIIQSSNELHSLYAERDRQTEGLADLRHTVASVQRPDPELALLQLKADSARTAWQQAEQRLSEAQIVDVMDQQGHRNISVLLRPTFSNAPVSPGPWLIIVCVLLGLVFLAVCLAIYLQRPREEDEEERPALTIRLRGPASNLLRGRRPNAYADLGREPYRPSDPPPVPHPPAPAPDHAQWEALAKLLQADRERALEAESAKIVEEEVFAEPAPETPPGESLLVRETRSHFVPPVPPFIEPPRTPRASAIDSEYAAMSVPAETARRPLILSAPSIFTAAVPNFVFERVQSTTTPGSLAFGLQATTLSPPIRSRVVAPSSPVIPPVSVPEPEPEAGPEPEPLPVFATELASLPVLEARADDESQAAHAPDPESSPEPVRLLPPVYVEVRTEALPAPLVMSRVPEILTGPLPPVAEQTPEADPEPIQGEAKAPPAKAPAVIADPMPPPPASKEISLGPSPPIPAEEELPARLTPFQRMKLRRAVPTLDKNGRATYITYTFDPDSDAGSDEKTDA